MGVAATSDLPTASLGLERFPSVALCHRSTPIEAMPRLSAALGGPQLFVKRDDCTGLAGGGNKTRKLEYLVGEALEQGADMLVTQGAVQSNHVRQTAAAACKTGLDCHALLERRVPDRAPDYEHTGNVRARRVGIARDVHVLTPPAMRLPARRMSNRLLDPVPGLATLADVASGSGAGLLGYRLS